MRCLQDDNNDVVGSSGDMSDKTGSVPTGASGKLKLSDEDRMKNRLADRFGPEQAVLLQAFLPRHVTSDTR